MYKPIRQVSPLPTSRFILCESSYEPERPEEVLAAYEQVCQLDPTNGTFHYHRANRLKALGRTAEAEQALQRARELGYKG